MSWEDSDALAARLDRSLDAFNWKEAEELCKQIIARIAADSELIPESLAKKLLGSLRRKRQFKLLTQLSEAILQSGLSTPLIRRQYAQALIDHGDFSRAEELLQSNLADPNSSPVELMEAHGLIGRIYKQIYVNDSDPHSPQSRQNLERALKEYLEPYSADPKTNTWHGINVVALVARARRDNQSIDWAPNPEAIAYEILKTLADREQEITDLPAWDLATRMEAYVALGKYEEAAATALKYIACKDADAFELSSTIRQFTEVWQLDDRQPPGNHLLPILKAGHLSKAGATAENTFKNVSEEAILTDEATKDCSALAGDNDATALDWYKQGLSQCRSIARLQKLNGEVLGTGWLVNASDFFPNETGILLLTNEHVISTDGEHARAHAEEALANFPSPGLTVKIKDVVWSSSHLDLDASFLSLETVPDVPPLQLEPEAVYQPSTRLYIVSSDSGNNDSSASAEQKVMVQDTYLLAQNETVFHYRTPEQGVGSGSPVYESQHWRVVALHHASNAVMPRIDGRGGTYEASEGISIAAIQRATKARFFERATLKGTMVATAGVPGGSLDDAAPAEVASQASFRITMEGEAAHETAVVFGTNCDLVFEYIVPPEVEMPIGGATVERKEMLQVPLGIIVIPIGFKFTAEGETGYRQVRFYQSARNEKVRFAVRATRDPHEVESAENETSESGFHIIFSLRGSVVRQLFLPVQLVKNLSEATAYAEGEKLCKFDLNYLKEFDDQTIQAQQRVAAALQKVLS
ncbi:MAG TPA: serine protease [Pyrinomonadaceae bacterium]|nr:serine protease [Pyrinomonadaceae bacterium]